jgi:septum site-determining protein MinC
MRTRQKSVRVFEIVTENYDKIVGLIESKYILLKKFLLIVKTENPKIKNYLENKEGLEVRFVDKNFVGSVDKLEMPTPEPEIKIIKETIVKENYVKTEIFDKIIRNGFELSSSNRLVFLKRINYGAKIYSVREIEIFGEVFGEVRCDGDYMIVKKAGEGRIIFHNEPLPEIKKLSYISKKGIKELE